MIQLELSTGKYCILPLPEDAEVQKTIPVMNVLGEQLRSDLVYTRESTFAIHFAELPPGTWTIIGTTKEICQSEELAKAIVDTEWGGFGGHLYGYKDYNSSTMDGEPCYLAIASFHSLCQLNKIPKHSVWLRKQETV